MSTIRTSATDSRSSEASKRRFEDVSYVLSYDIDRGARRGRRNRVERTEGVTPVDSTNDSKEMSLERARRRYGYAGAVTTTTTTKEVMSRVKAPSDDGRKEVTNLGVTRDRFEPTRTAAEYEFVTLGARNATRTTTKTASTEMKFKDVPVTLEESGVIGESASPAVQSWSGAKALNPKSAPWSSAVSERAKMASRADTIGSRDEVTRKFASYGELFGSKGSDDSAVRDSDSAPSADGAPMVDPSLATRTESIRDKFRDSTNVLLAAKSFDKLQVARAATRAVQSPTRDTQDTRDTQRTSASHGSASFLLQYQQGDGSEIESLLSHRKGDLFRRFGKWLNEQFIAFTGFKVVPTFPLEKRIERFVIGNGMRL